jgi:hypothetical protein
MIVCHVDLKLPVPSVPITTLIFPFGISAGLQTSSGDIR